ncbi:MAG: DUF4197 domain-containing protein [Candidatus Kapabacteria bacterium]|nr:DUF4197 domain-containing protein [Candidatus Kapabacteria bacterium]
MKKIFYPTSIIIIGLLIFSSTSLNAQLFDELKGEASKIIKKGTIDPRIGTIDTGRTNIGFTEAEAAKAIKEALVQGTSKGTDIVSKLDGFYKNPEIKIPFPEKAKTVEQTLRKIGMGKQCDNVILSVNRAAEDASKSAKDIVVNAITKMTISDAINIIKGDSIAATRYLKEKTTKALVAAFSPIVKKSLDKVDATKYWKDAMTLYNKIPLVEKVNPNLTEYVTNKAIEGLFLMIAKEEQNIRKDPVARTSDILKKVFGGLFK